MLSSTPCSSTGWPVASLHALLAFSRTLSRSAPAMASPSGRSGAGPSLARDGRSPPSPLPTSEHSLCLGSVTVLPAEHHHFQREALLTQSWENQCAGCVSSQRVACSSLGKLKFYFHMELCGLSVSPPSLMGFINTAPLLLSSLSRATSWLWRQKKTEFKSAQFGDYSVVQWFRLHASTAGGMGLIPGWGSLHATWNSQKEKKRKSTQFLRATSLSSG